MFLKKVVILRKKMLQLIFLLLLTIFFFSCSTVKVYHTSQLTKFPKNYFVYVLPKTEITVDVVVEKIIYNKGPFAQYSEKYLGISNVSLTNYERYYIKDIKLNTSLVADSEQIFVITFKNKLPWKSITQTNDGIITNLNTIEKNFSVTHLQKRNYIEKNKLNDNIFYIELSKSPFVKEKIDTVFKQVKVDTLWVKVPTQRKTIDSLKPVEKAKEAAKVIFDIRTRMFDLFSGELEILPQGESAEYIAEELRKQEQEYLELFIGKTFKTYETYSFKIVPTTNENNLYTLSYFSENKGISESPQKDSEPLMLQIKSSQAYTNFTYQILKLQKAKKINAFYFKYPNKSVVRILHDNEILLEQDIWNYQTGRILKLPVKFLKNGCLYFDNEQIYFKQL